MAEITLVTCGSSSGNPEFSRVGTCQRTTWLLMVTVLVALYLPVITARYGFSDDFYVFLGEADLATPLYLSAGRLVPAAGQQLLFGRIHTVGSLGILRGVSLIGLIGLCSIFYLLLRRLTDSPLQQVALCLGLATLPSLLEFVAWACCWLYLPAACLSSVAGVLTLGAFTSNDSSRSRRAVILGTAFLLMLVSVATYQPSAMWFWVVVLICLLDDSVLHSADARRRLGQVIVAGLMFLLVAFVLFKLALVLSGIVPDSRGQLLRTPDAKAYSLVREQLSLALNLWHLAEPARKGTIVAVAAITATVIILGYLVFCRRHLRQPDKGDRRRWREVFTWTGMVLLVVTCSHAHWLVIDENPMNYRLVSSLAGAVLILAFWALREFSRLTREDRRRTVQTMAAVILLIGTVALGAYHLQRYWIEPYTTGYRYVLYCLRQTPQEPFRHVHVIRQSPYDGLVPQWTVYDFGRPLTDPPWVPSGLVRAALAEMQTAAPRVERITHGDASEPIPTGRGILVIDMRKIAEFR